VRRPARALAALALLAAGPALAEELIRVVVAEGLATASLAGEGLRLRPAGEDGEWRPAGAEVELAAAEGGLSVRGEPAGGPVALSAAGPIRLGGRRLSPAVEVEPGPGGLTVIEELPLDDYVAGVVSGEMPGGFPAEAQKAQAVAARSYALVRKIEAEASGRSWHLGAGVLSQVFAGTEANPAARAAAAATRGEVLVWGNEPVEAFFHAACGGRTEAGLDALGRDLPYLRPVACGRCDGAPRVRWALEVSAAELGHAAGLPGPATGARVSERSATGRAARLAVAGSGRTVTVPATLLRQRLGYGRLPSLAFEVRERGGGFAFSGRGQGHGAGLCQRGAAGLAREGKGYREILRHYYPGTGIATMY
jgi:stage II sporulation protein D